MDDDLDSAEGGEKADDATARVGPGNRFLPSDYREDNSPRRSEEDRRQADEGAEGGERRETQGRRNRVDRRSMALEVTCKTTGSINTIEDWLVDHCKSDCQVVLQTIDDDMVIKHLKVMFENEADRDLFLDKYLKFDE
ncbi:MAG: hypothetical protein O3A85_07415 [Proteobacteria bacterium]|nr:hypothetical protein [Pseudomonadota bacterium]